jgi:hypothetical protein
MNEQDPNAADTAEIVASQEAVSPGEAFLHL